MVRARSRPRRRSVVDAWRRRGGGERRGTWRASRRSPRGPRRRVDRPREGRRRRQRRSRRLPRGRDPRSTRGRTRRGRRRLTKRRRVARRTDHRRTRRGERVRRQGMRGRRKDRRARGLQSVSSTRTTTTRRARRATRGRPARDASRTGEREGNLRSRKRLSRRNGRIAAGGITRGEFSCFEDWITGGDSCNISFVTVRHSVFRSAAKTPPPGSKKGRVDGSWRWASPARVHASQRSEPRRASRYVARTNPPRSSDPSLDPRTIVDVSPARDRAPDPRARFEPTKDFCNERAGASLRAPRERLPRGKRLIVSRLATLVDMPTSSRPVRRVRSSLARPSLRIAARSTVRHRARSNATRVSKKLPPLSSVVDSPRFLRLPAIFPHHRQAPHRHHEHDG